MNSSVNSSKRQVFFKVLALIAITSLLFTGGGFSASAQGLQPGTDANPPSSLGGCANSLSEIGYSAQTGKVSFIGSAAKSPIAQPNQLRAVSPEQAARAYLSVCGSLFGLGDQATELHLLRQSQAEGGRAVLRFQQVYQGVPVYGAQLVVQLNAANNVLMVSGEMSPVSKLAITPGVDAAKAQEIALQSVAQEYGVSSDGLTLTASTPALNIYDPKLIQMDGNGTALVWVMTVSQDGPPPVRQLVMVDAKSGKIALSLNLLETDSNRRTYDMGNTTTYPGTLVCDDTNPTCAGGDAHEVNAHVYAADTYNFYWDYHGRDSIDNAGMLLYSHVHYDVGYCNAFWNGLRMTYGDGCFIVVDDVVAHEMTHGVTEYESGLVYANQSGAINESFSDIWGEWIDLTNGKGNDASSERWKVGEDTSMGAIRNMQDPTLFGDPNRMDSPNYYWGSSDNGGVHTNSGVGNKAAYLITDGDTFNSYTVSGLGITKAAKIYYEVQTNILTPSSDYYALYLGLYQACNNLIGTSGIIADDCTQVRNATLATEMDHYPPPPAPANDDFNFPTIISSVPYTTSQNIAGATTAIDDPSFSCVSGQKSNSVWYRYTPAANVTLNLDTFGSNFDTVLAVWTGSRGSLTSVACNDDAAGGVQSQVSFGAAAGVNYYIEAASFYAGGGTLTLNASAAGATTWVTKTAMSKARSRPAAAAVGGKVYVIGGESATFGFSIKGGSAGADAESWTEQVWTSSVEEYNPALNSWMSKAPKTTAVSNTSAAVLYNKIYVPGGWNGTVAQSVVEVYDPALNSWSSVAPLPAAQYGHAVAAVGSKLYVIGGYNGTSYLNTCYAYDLGLNSWSGCAPMTYARGFAAAGVVNGKIYVVGGRDGTNSDFNYVEEYDPVANTWATKTAMSTARGGPGAVGYGSYLYVCGGGWSSYLTSCAKFDPAANTWSAFDPLNSGRRTLAMVEANGKLYAEGGYNGSYLAVNEENASPIPPAPLNVAASDSTFTDKVQVTWDAATGATNYQVYRATTVDGTKTLLFTIPASPYDDTTAAIGTAYYYWVKACNGSGCSDFSAWDNGWRNLTAPANVAASDGAYADKVRVTWDTVIGADNYWVFRADSAGGTKTLLGTPAAAPYDDATGTPGVTYYYWLKACNSFGYCSDYSAYNTGWRTGPLFGKDSPFNGVTNRPLSLTLYWKASSGATSYEYCVDTTNDDACAGSWVSTGLTRSAALSGLGLATTYYWQARAISVLTTTYADGGAWWSFTTGNVPAAFNKTSPANAATNQPGSLSLQWAVSSGAASYEYCYDTLNDNTCNGSWVSTGTTRSAALSGLSASTTYYWQARAINSFGTTYANGGAWWSFRTGAVPAAFGKDSPFNGVVKKPLSLTLYWKASSGAVSYEYCYDTVNDNVCNRSWISTGLTRNAAISGLSTGTTYYWQVRALSGFATTVADGGVWWSFTTGNLPAAFNKTSPANLASNQAGNLNLQWGASSGATTYEYCYDTLNDNTCNATWVSAGAGTSAAISGLSVATTYYWQVRAVNNIGTTYANSNAWWSFTTGLPAAFDKDSPFNAARNKPLSLTLYWKASSGASSYEYCFDTINNGNCDGSWVSTGTIRNALIGGLSRGTTYYWQVRAVNGFGATLANSGAWWSFTTIP
jgi:Zn-dependent metalloprotease